MRFSTPLAALAAAALLVLYLQPWSAQREQLEKGDDGASLAAAVVRSTSRAPAAPAPMQVAAESRAPGSAGAESRAGPLALPEPTHFREVDAPAPARLERSVLRERHVRIDPAAFTEAASLHWRLFDDIEHELVLDDAKWKSIDGSKLAWHGHVAGDPGSEVLILVHDGAVTGNISLTDGTLYAIDTLPGDVQRIQQIDVSAYPDCGNEHAALLAQAAGDEGGPPAAPPPGAAAAGGPEVIDVLIAYTPAARAYYGGTQALEDRLDLLIDWSNAVYENSGASQRLRAAGFVEVAYDDSHGDGGTALNDVTYSGDGELEDVPELRDAHGADMVSLVTAPNNVCGIAWVASSASLIGWYEDYMYSVVNVQCLGSPRTFTHELAHNQGAYHDPETSLAGGMSQSEIDDVPFPNSFGYIAPGDAFRTIMAYGSSCGWCPALEQFSNKDQTHQGLATGNARSNVHETLENTYLTIAAFRDAVSCTGQGDADADGVCDGLDNCVQQANPGQGDSDLDGFGNACDADYDNDGSVGIPDFSMIVEMMGSVAPDPAYDAIYDHTEDGAIGVPDFAFLVNQIGGAPGPSALTCAGTIPCGAQ